MFIDGPNLYKCHKEQEDWGVDMIKLKQEVPEALNLELLDAFYYTVSTDPIWFRMQGHKANFPIDFNFCKILIPMGYKIIVIGYLKEIYFEGEEKVMEKGVDVRLAVDMVRMKEHYDQAILISGDGDFLPAIDIIQRKYSKRVNVCFYENSTSKYLKEFCNFLPFEEIRDRIEYKL